MPSQLCDGSTIILTFLVVVVVVVVVVVAAKMLCIHYVVGVSHFAAECHKNRLVTL